MTNKEILLSRCLHCIGYSAKDSEVKHYIRSGTTIYDLLDFQIFFWDFLKDMGIDRDNPYYDEEIDDMISIVFKGENMNGWYHCKVDNVDYLLTLAY